MVRPPGPRARELVKKDEAVISPSYVRFYPLVIDSGKGSILKDVDGNEYIDFNSGLVCLNVGHLHPKVVEGIKSQCERFLHYSNTDFYYKEVVDLAGKLSGISPGRFKKRVYFGNSGTEAVEAAAKVSKWHTRNHQFIAFTGAFHGRTLGSLAFTASKPVQKRYFFPMLPGVTHVPYPYCYRCPFKLSYPDCDYWCVDFIDELILQKYVPPKEVAAIIFEPIQGEGGYVVPPEGYFQRLKKLADKYHLLLIDDEIQAGMGRTGKWFAIEHWNVEPDIVCAAKAVASGLPLGATVARARIMDWEGGSHASTFGGNPLACRAALAVIDVIEEENLLEKAAKQGDYILKRLEDLKEECGIIGDVRGKGLMIGIEVVEDEETKEPGRDKAKEIMMRCWRRGIALITCGVSTIRIAPPLNITRELIEAGIEIIEDVVKEVEKK
ncbi:acetyl ornithine aminotransferase family protein [Candidatus Bathyarchaeota archaeon]|nr:acetyl ornithine aminotransferase family protein [Candidatus Bathyarchaeota archaeon]NIR17578.1 acetyl ornithine aminotransferase family protein [Desulfobacterales bacterium]NIU81266.1 acetyl ornithine aminotransferase family protein [Candidatus Bathyarchaeota archaeon]NIV67910.1 acetyl ornithine aminotransferase family protein [Candidatus Bathyarchaeota archaeon]NIW16355.1 acetyl ornithine aminotransferase family protein [Candidatus Bathyarchaeota archaeon]